MNNLLFYALILMRGLTMHKQFLLAALEQAWIGRGQCAPNPSVGAVAVQYGKIIAQAHHHGAGTAHAEALVLQMLPENCPDITLYVTLEPCNHWGRTPPCVDAIINHGIKEVVYGYVDPNPLVSTNNTNELLKAQNIDVLHYPLPEIDAFYQSYHHWVLTGRPWITAKIAQTFDGKVGLKDSRALLSNALCAEFTHQKRLRCDIILTTSQTINHDDPWLNVRLPDINLSKPIAIIDSHLKINPNAKLLAHGSPIHFYHAEKTKGSKLDSNTCAYHAMPYAKSGDVLDLSAIITHLGALGYHDVWVEAGGTLFNALHQAQLVNQTFIYLVPAILGDEAIGVWTCKTIFNRPHSIRWQAMEDNMIAQIDWASSDIMK